MNFLKRFKRKRQQNYLVKGMMSAVKEIEAKHKASSVDIPKLLANLDKGIAGINEEVELFTKALDLVETKYGKSQEAAEIATIFPFLVYL